ncbi:MAG: serine/threonine-protein kinase [Myxococcota bacterium]
MDTLTDADGGEDSGAGSGGRMRSETAVDARDGAGGRERAASTSEPGNHGRGALLGRYVLLDRIGVGGMGSVYAAYDPELDRRVALKLLKSGASDTGRARLIREAQAIARVSHPNVVTVHDVGTYDDGVFVAMELVDGQDLRTWLREEKRAWPEVVEAFVAAARGLGAAHAAGLVHRDFKPANVLRAHDGQIRVVDFGLARLTRTGPSHPDSSEDELVSGSAAAISSEVELTRTGALMGTPAYMAPEQHVRGEVEPRTDQFGFCVALYEALYGARPFKAPNRMALMFTVGRGEVPPPPKDSDVPARLHAVVARGLRPAVEERWPTMDALVAALQADPSRRRGRIVAAVGVGALAIGGAFAVGRAELTQPAPCSGAQAHMDRAWNDGSRAALATAFAATELPYAQRSADWVTGELDRWSQDWVAAHTDACEATAVRGEQSEALLDLRMLCLDSQRGRMRAIVDLLQDADATVVERVGHAIAGLPTVAHCADPDRLRSAIPLPDDETTRAAVGEIRSALWRAKALETAGRYEAGLQVTDAALVRARALEYPPLLAEALAAHATLQARAGDKQAVAVTLHAAAAAATVAGDDALLAEVWTKLVHQVGLDESRHDDALRWAEYARAAVVRSGNQAGDRADLEHAVGSVLWAADRNDEALEHLQLALRLQRELDGDGPLVAQRLSTLGNVQIRRGEPERALEAFEEAYTIFVAAYGEQHPQVGIVHNALGVAHYFLHDLSAAAEDYQRAYDVMLATLGPDHPDLLFSLGNIGNIRREQGRLPEALDAMMEVRELVRRAYPPVHREAGMTAHNIGETLREMERAPEALPYYRDALRIREEVHGADGRYVANTLTGLGETLIDLQRAEEATPHLERALKIRLRSEQGDPDPRAMARTRFALARAIAGTPGGASRARSLAEAAAAQLPEVDSEVARRQRAALDAFLASLPKAHAEPPDR